jgi:lipopolysaccharide transport system ATP-binding protein
MVGDVVIRADGLGKKYIIGHEVERERYVALRDVLTRTARNVWRKTVDMIHGRPIVSGDVTEEFWALKDVSFEVKRGEVLGIIGRNGAGKSTLLKILSRITEPSEGRVTIKGRVASLLEVGTGFHPELTGRENIFLNGAILGMTRAEIKRKFDEIVAFAEVEEFLDTPVKRYSSGMNVRLAFAVAAHLEPEILIIDEVLAVGDAEFQKKCLGKMGEVAGGGRTVLFVSHNISALLATCQTGIALEGGCVRYRGTISEAAAAYQASHRQLASGLENRVFSGPLKSALHFEQIEVNGSLADVSNGVAPEEEVTISVKGQSSCDVAGLSFVISLSAQGTRLFTVQDSAELLPRGPFEVEFALPKGLLRPGRFDIAVGARTHPTDDWIWGLDLAELHVLPVWSPRMRSDDHGLVTVPARVMRKHKKRPRVAEHSS